MKIKSLQVWSLPLLSHDTYYMADGKTCDSVESIIVEIITDSGISGWGEVCPIPHYLPAYSEGVLPALNYMMPCLKHADPVGPEALMHKLDGFLQGHDYAKSAIDTALWDISAKAANMPLYRLLGGACSHELPLYHSITCVDADEMVRMAKAAYDEGIRQFQCKLGADNNWQNDVERLLKVREAVGDGPLVYGDWNCGSTQLDAIRVARAVNHKDIMLEQPCNTLESCAGVKRACHLPMKIDESARDISTLHKAHTLGCLDAVALKLSKFGGLSAMRRARDYCLQLGARMCIEDTWGTDITTSTALHLAAATPERLVLNVCDLSGYVSPRLDQNAPSRRMGKLRVNEAVGHGVNPDRDLLGEPLAILD